MPLSSLVEKASQSALLKFYLGLRNILQMEFVSPLILKQAYAENEERHQGPFCLLAQIGYLNKNQNLVCTMPMD